MKYTNNDVICLAILEKLERFRTQIENNEIQCGSPNWIVRMCEAAVTDYTQWDDRATWLKELQMSHNLK